jgi:hypothetical protein
MTGCYHLRPQDGELHLAPVPPLPPVTVRQPVSLLAPAAATPTPTPFTTTLNAPATAIQIDWSDDLSIWTAAVRLSLATPQPLTLIDYDNLDSPHRFYRLRPTQ